MFVPVFAVASSPSVANGSITSVRSRSQGPVVLTYSRGRVLDANTLRAEELA